MFEITTDEGNKTQTDVCFNEKFYNYKDVHNFGVILYNDSKNGLKVKGEVYLGYIGIYLSKGMDIKGTYKSNGLIHQWVNYGDHNFELLNSLISLGADLNIKNNKGKTPLMNACEKNENIILGYLLEAGANVNKQDHDGNTAAHYCIQNGCNNSLLKALKDAKADLTIQNNNGKTAMELKFK